MRVVAVIITLNKFNAVTITSKIPIKGEQKVVKTEIAHTDYVDVLDTSTSIGRDVTSIRSYNHQFYTFNQSKIALTIYS